MKRKTLILIILCLLSLSIAGCSFESFWDNSSDDNSNVQSKKITMPKASSQYLTSSWTIDSLKKHFLELGFSDVIVSPLNGQQEDMRKEVLDITIDEGGLLGTYTSKWSAGDSFRSYAKVTIYQNSNKVLTVDNCADLKTILTSTEMDYLEFASKYNNKYVEFDAHIVKNDYEYALAEYFTYIKGGNSGSDENGIQIYLDVKNPLSDFDMDIPVGTNVKIIGKVEYKRSNFFKELTIYLISIKKR